MIYDKVSFHYPSAKCKSLLTSIDHMKKLLKALDNISVLSDYGKEQIENITSEFELKSDMLTDIGNSLVSNYLFRMNKIIKYNESQEKINKFWMDRMHDYYTITKPTKIYQYITFEEYIERILFNITRDTSRIEFDITLDNSTLCLRCLLFDKDNKRINMEKYYQLLSYRSEYLIDSTLSIQTNYTEYKESIEKNILAIKEKYEFMDNVINLPTIFTFNELRIRI